MSRLEAGNPPSSATDRDHYSYRLYANRRMAAEFDERRFGGVIGALLAETQERVLIDFAGAVRGREVLDVGTGTGRGALIFAREGAHVTGVDASEEMLNVARQRAADAGLAVRFEQADAHALPFDALSFDVAVSLRVLMHAPDWRRCLIELCRVSRERVIVDFPAVGSIAALESRARRIAARLGKEVEAYRVFRLQDLRREFGHHNYEVTRVHRQFVLPIALHKRVGNRKVSEWMERALARAGLCGSSDLP